MFADGKTKAVTFSYDDGVIQDKRLIEIFNKYGLKGTFNLNSGIMSGASNWMYKKGKAVRMNLSEIGDTYKGHEIAVHCLTHANLVSFDKETIKNEILYDKENLERIFGEKIVGMAYPYGEYNEGVIECAKDCGIKYSRTVKSTHTFDTSDNLLEYHPTAHHDDPMLFDLADEFISMKPDKPRLFYIWGHSYEFDGMENWDRIEKFCRMISGKDDICYCTNTEAFIGMGKL